MTILYIMPVFYNTNTFIFFKVYKYKIFNNLAKEGINVLTEASYIQDDSGPDALILRSFPLSSEDITKNTKCISRAGAGTNNIPIDEATKKGIVVFNTPGANANAVKELVLCGMLLASRGIIQGNAYAESLQNKSSDELNKLIENQKKYFKGNELNGKTIGIVGLGSIGSLLAQATNVLGMKIIGFDPYLSVDGAWMLPKEVQKADSLEYLLSNSDYITLHIPLTKDTENFISKKNIKTFKTGAKLINLSRGRIVNNDDILTALDNEKISTYVTDFPTPDLIKRSVQNRGVILLPHIGASTKEAEINCAVMACEQVRNYLENGFITNSVNFPNIRLGRTSKFRLVIIHKDEPGMIVKITSEIANENLNISDMINKSRNENAITLIDLATKPSEKLIKCIEKMRKVVSIRTC